MACVNALASTIPGTPTKDSFERISSRACRRLEKRPAFRAIARLTTALGVGASATIFSLTMTAQCDPVCSVLQSRGPGPDPCSFAFAPMGVSLLPGCLRPLLERPDRREARLEKGAICAIHPWSLLANMGIAASARSHRSPLSAFPSSASESHRHHHRGQSRCRSRPPASLPLSTHGLAPAREDIPYRALNLSIHHFPPAASLPIVLFRFPARAKHCMRPSVAPGQCGNL